VFSACLVVLVLAPASAGKTVQTAPRLEGKWSVSIVFTAAVGLKDRKAGQKVTETWVMRPRCRTGPCDVVLRRTGRKPLSLLRRTVSTYTGKQSFTGTFFCNGRTYASGTTYVESWTVRIVRSGPGPRGRHALRIAGVGATVGRSSDALPCAPVVSSERVEFTGVLARR
jgi:hypothetical protein